MAVKIRRPRPRSGGHFGAPGRTTCPGGTAPQPDRIRKLGGGDRAGDGGLGARRLRPWADFRAVPGLARRVGGRCGCRQCGGHGGRHPAHLRRIHHLRLAGGGGDAFPGSLVGARPHPGTFDVRATAEVSLPADGRR